MAAVFETERLRIRRSQPTDKDVEFLHRLWTTPEVMINVGFPQGLRITRDKVHRQLTEQPDSEFEVRLLAIRKADGRIIGECKLGRPDCDGISEGDVKLMPEFWRQGFGGEIKKGLVDYTFAHTDAVIIKATPNQNNIGSQRMQETVGARRVGEHVYRFPEHMRSYTCNVPCYVYHLTREEWEKRRRIEAWRH
ncbi:MAG: GNAT family protein [bacterium]